MQWHESTSEMPEIYRPLTRNMRIWFLIDCVLLAMAGIQLFVLVSTTNRFFAWTIAPPLTAAFLGAGYIGSLPLVYLSSRQKLWANARLAVFGVLIFTIATLVASLIHLDRFHFASPEPTARFAAWIWLLIYILVPPTLLILTIMQLRVPGIDPPRSARLFKWIRATLTIQAGVLLLMGAILFAFPLSVPWPWTLTPLTGRAIAAWLIGIGVIVGQMIWENDLSRIRNGMLSYAVVSVLQLLALARYASYVDWKQPAAAVYLVFLFSTLVVGNAGWLSARSVPPVENPVIP